MCAYCYLLLLLLSEWRDLDAELVVSNERLVARQAHVDPSLRARTSGGHGHASAEQLEVGRRGASRSATALDPVADEERTTAAAAAAAAAILHVLF